MEFLSEGDKEHIKLLREEAWQVKDCFTKYSFQAMVFGTVVLGLIVRYQKEYPFIGLASLLVILFIIAVARIGTHKYTTANRNYGYQLFIERTSRLKALKHSKMLALLRNIGWEEAMHAWRIVQSKTFDNIYTTGFWKINKLKNHNGKEIEYKWFEPEYLVGESGKWHAGGYLGNMLLVLYIIAFISLLPLIYLSYAMYIDKEYETFIASTIITVITLGVVVFRYRKTNARRKILEKGLLCINSCEIMWHAVVVAHHRAIENININQDVLLPKFNELSKQLSTQALELNKDIEKIYEWIGEYYIKAAQQQVEADGSP